MLNEEKKLTLIEAPCVFPLASGLQLEPDLIFKNLRIQLFWFEKGIASTK